MIDKSDLTLRRQVDADAREPFPVAVMAEYACGVLTLAEVLLHFLAVDNRQPLAKLAVADAEQLDSLKEIVAEPLIELTFRAAYFLCAHFGERRG